MSASWRRSAPWLLGWVALVLAGAFALVRLDIAQRREAFMNDARTAHRLLSQRAGQHEAILATLALLSPDAHAERFGQRLTDLYPQVTAVLRRTGVAQWPDGGLRTAEAESLALHRAALGPVDADAAHYVLMLAGEPSSFALRIDPRRMVAPEEWPLRPDGPVRATLMHDGRTIVLQPGQAATLQPAGLTEGFVFAELLSTASQPFELRLQRATGPAEWPWPKLALWALFALLALAAVAAWLRVRRERRRAEGLLRVGRVARLNALGELAGGMAHELNQPLSAVLASAQAARRLLDEEPPELATARHAMTLVEMQSRRAAEVVARLRRLVEAPASSALQPVRLEATLRSVLNLLEPDAHRAGIGIAVEGHAPAVLADPVALEQIVHNLLENAMQALQRVPRDTRRIVLHVGTEDGQGVLAVRDNGPGMSPEVLAHAFEPFYTTREGGLGLGLSLCETLAATMGGTLTAANAANATLAGAEFRLTLPLASPA